MQRSSVAQSSGERSFSLPSQISHTPWSFALILCLSLTCPSLTTRRPPLANVLGPRHSSESLLDPLRLAAHPRAARYFPLADVARRLSLALTRPGSDARLRAVWTRLSTLAVVPAHRSLLDPVRVLSPGSGRFLRQNFSGSGFGRPAVLAVLMLSRSLLRALRTAGDQSAWSPAIVRRQRILLLHENSALRTRFVFLVPDTTSTSVNFLCFGTRLGCFNPCTGTANPHSTSTLRYLQNLRIPGPRSRGSRVPLDSPAIPCHFVFEFPGCKHRNSVRINRYR